MGQAQCESYTIANHGAALESIGPGSASRYLLLQELVPGCYLAVTRAADESSEASCAYFY